MPTTIVNLTDNVSVSDSLARVVVLPRSISDSIILVDTVGPHANLAPQSPDLIVTAPSRTNLTLSPDLVVTAPLRTNLAGIVPSFTTTAPVRSNLVAQHPIIEYTFVWPIVLDADAKRYRIFISDLAGNTVHVPQDVLTFSLEDTVNGGSGQGQMTFPRRFVDQGWLGYRYRVQFYLDDSLDPWYDGRIMEFDPEQTSGQTDNEQITIHLEGWQTKLADTPLTETLTPSVEFGTMNADTYIVHLLQTYVDANYFGPSYVTAMPFALDELTFDGTELNKALDDIVKQVQDNTGNIFEWWVRGVKGGKPAIVVQPSQNPNLVSLPSFYTPVRAINTTCLLEFMDSTIYDYKIQNSASNLYNMIALYGGTVNNVQIYGAFKDSTSISLFGLRQKKVTNTSLLSQQSLVNYATVYLLLNGYPQPQGSFKKWVASDFARAGQWFQVMEPGLSEVNVKYIVEPTIRTFTTGPVSAGANSIPVASTVGITAGQAVAVGNNPPIAIDHIAGSNLILVSGLLVAAVNNAPVSNVEQFSAVHAQNARQSRAVKVALTLAQNADRIIQEVFVAAPRPYIDHAYYSAINQASSSRATASSVGVPTQLADYYVLAGGDYVGP